jgi:hypothetical protein
LIELKVLPSISTIAGTTDGKYYYRISDNCNPLPPDELMRLLTDKPSYIWETKVVRSVPKTNKIKFQLDQMKQKGEISSKGEKRWCRYSINKKA